MAELPPVLRGNHAATVVHAPLDERIADVVAALRLDVDNQLNDALTFGKDGAKVSPYGRGVAVRRQRGLKSLSALRATLPKGEGFGRRILFLRKSLGEKRFKAAFVTRRRF